MIFIKLSKGAAKLALPSLNVGKVKKYPKLSWRVSKPFYIEIDYT